MLSRNCPVPPPPSPAPVPEPCPAHHRLRTGRVTRPRWALARALIAVSACTLAGVTSPFAVAGYTFADRVGRTSGWSLLAAATPASFGLVLVALDLASRRRRPRPR